MHKDLQVLIEDLIHVIDIRLPNGRFYNEQLEDAVEDLENYIDRYYNRDLNG